MENKKNVEWLPANQWHDPHFSTDFREKLLDPNSMTARMKIECKQKFYLTLLSQTEKPIFPSEAKILNADENIVLTVREVEMGCDEKAWLFGRSVMPAILFEGESGEHLKNLGSRPLGEVLFQDPSLVRSEFEIAEITPQHAEFAWLTRYTLSHAVLARRSLFYFYQKPLLLTEVFLQ